MADGELFAAMHDVGLAEFVAKGLDKKHRKALVPLDVSGMTVSASMGIFERHLRHFQAVLGGSRA